MFTLNDLMLLAGLGWDEGYSDKLDITFHEQDGGISEKVTGHCKGWTQQVELKAPSQTAHLPVTMTFKLDDFKVLCRKLKNGYKNIHILLPLQFTESGMEVLYGPAKGCKLNNLRR